MEDGRRQLDHNVPKKIQGLTVFVAPAPQYIFHNLLRLPFRVILAGAFFDSVVTFCGRSRGLLGLGLSIRKSRLPFSVLVALQVLKPQLP
jgi:hypothetical protein